jgi:DNA-binding PadR family transcriptional regulator
MADLPLSEPVFHALLALLEGPRHGYGIILRVEEWTEGRIRLKTGTLYTALGRLREAGWIEESDDVAEDDDERRRYYRLTAAGRAVVHEEMRRLESVVRLARSVRASAGAEA